MAARGRPTEAPSRDAENRTVRKRAWLAAMGLFGIALVALFRDEASSPSVAPTPTHRAEPAQRLSVAPAVLDPGDPDDAVPATSRRPVVSSLRIVDEDDGTAIAAAAIELVDGDVQFLAAVQSDADGEVTIPSDIAWRAGSATAPGYGIVGFDRGQSVVALHRPIELEVVLVDDAGEIVDGMPDVPSDPQMTLQLVIRADRYQPGEALAARAAVAAYARGEPARQVESRTWGLTITQPLRLTGVVRADALHETTGEWMHLGFARFTAHDRRVKILARKRFRHAGAEWCGVSVRLPHAILATSLSAELRGSYDAHATTLTQPSASAPQTLDGDRFDMTLLHRPVPDARVSVYLTTELGMWRASGRVELVAGRRVDFEPWTANTALELEFLALDGGPRTERVDWTAEFEAPPTIYASENLGPAHVRIRHLPPGEYRMRSPFATPRSFEIRPDQPVRVTIAADPRGPRVPITVHLPNGTTARFLDPSTRRVVQVVFPATDRLVMHAGSYTLEFEHADGRVETSAVEVRKGVVLDLR